MLSIRAPREREERSAMKKESKGGQSDKAGFPKAGFSKETAYEMKLEKHKKHERKKDAATAQGQEYRTNGHAIWGSG